MRLFSSKGIRFSGDSIKSCVGFIDVVDSTKNIVMMEGLENIRKYYSLFILFTYRMFLRTYDYHITSFTDPTIALNYIRDIPNFDDLLVILDMRMKDLNGFQLYQQIKSIDPSIKILFVTSLDILDELLSIVPGVIKEQIMRKPVDKKLFTNTVNKILLN
ncbi:MAG TPA: response regulator [Nitrososphaeraceae archaeon]